LFQSRCQKYTLNNLLLQKTLHQKLISTQNTTHQKIS